MAINNITERSYSCAFPEWPAYESIGFYLENTEVGKEKTHEFDQREG